MALTWNQQSSAETDAAKLISQRIHAVPGWSCVLEVQGLRVFHSGARPGASDTLLLPDRRGAILGKIFKARSGASGSSPVVTIDEQESVRIVASGGAHLTAAYWGRYVAVLYDAAAAGTFVLRDPAGAINCLLTEHCGVRIFCSDIADCLRIGIDQFTVNWRYVAGLVCNRSQQTRQTGLVGVSEVQPGERVLLHDGVATRSFLWHPFRQARSNPIRDASTAATELNRAIRDCVHAWGSSYSGILHRLSGGLDSSIVASCLHDAPTAPSVTCVNYFGHGPQEDERRYARLVAQRMGFPLIEHEHRPDLVQLESILNVAQTDRPHFYIYGVEHTALETQWAKSCGATAMFGGAGGDGLFYQNSGALAAVDYMFDSGMHPSLLGVALDAARVDRLSIWAVLRSALSESLQAEPWNPQNEVGRGKTFVRRDVIESVKRDPTLAHPWMEEAHGIPHGKRWHVMSAWTTIPFYDPLGGPDDPENVYPLMSQPIFEVCFRIPTYVLIDGGWDRAIARRAFRSHLPPEIVNRRAKGGSTGMMKKLFERNIPFVRELLLDGSLVREGLLDKKLLEAHLTPGKAVAGLAFGEILMEHLCTEAWLARWACSSRTACAA